MYPRKSSHTSTYVFMYIYYALIHPYICIIYIHKYISSHTSTKTPYLSRIHTSCGMSGGMCSASPSQSPYMSRVTQMYEFCHTYEWVMSHVWMSHSTHMTESCHTYEWVMSHIWTSHATLMKKSRPTHRRRHTREIVCCPRHWHA
jgi:hypothetical protein